MNRKITLIPAIAFGLLSLSACTPRQIVEGVERLNNKPDHVDYSVPVVVTDVRPVERITDSPVTTTPCEGAFRPGVTEGADNLPVPCDAPIVLTDEGPEGAHR